MVPHQPGEHPDYAAARGAIVPGIKTEMQTGGGGDKKRDDNCLADSNCSSLSPVSIEPISNKGKRYANGHN